MKNLKKYKKILIIVILLILVIGSITIESKAVIPIDTAYIYANRKTDGLLRWNGIGIHTYVAVYKQDGVEYPAYCLNRDLPGVETGPQNVDVNSLISDVMVWRAIINGYPYKSISELGCESEDEAYLATKQAVYCMLTNRDVSEYSAIGESGERTLNALIQIVNKARNSGEVKVSPDLTINQINSIWQVDTIDSKYVYQEFKVTTNAPFNSYKVEVSDLNLEGVIVVDENNNKKNEFKSQEIFKVLIPIANLLEDGSFKIHVLGEVRTKPVFYGKSYDQSLQNYALAGFTYEDGEGDSKVNYSKNETKLIIIKKDETGKKYLKDVEFSLLDENKNEVKKGLRTDENGKIEITNLVPGKYYIKETKTVEGYESYQELIEVNLELNEVSTINVTNKEMPKIEIQNPVEENVVKLPKTGM